MVQSNLNLTSAKILCFGYGNPGRGDDAIGPMLIDYIESRKFTGVDCIYDMQLQIEDITEFDKYRKIIFIDADTSCTAPFQFTAISARKDDSYTSHAMTAEAVLHAYWEIYGKNAPPAYMLSIRGYSFGLEDRLGKKAEINLDKAKTFIDSYLKKAILPSK